MATLHRPANVDTPDAAASLVAALRDAAGACPSSCRSTRAAARASRRPASTTSPGLRVVEPLGYLDFLSLVRGAAVVITDSGGIQEETTVLDVPCLTLRPNTERPITITAGTNRLVTPGASPASSTRRSAVPWRRPGDGPPGLGRSRRGTHRRGPRRAREPRPAGLVNARRSPRSAILLPSYPWNPYQRLLAAALTQQGLDARAVGSWPTHLPILRAWLTQGRPDVVHLHWLHEFLGGSRSVASRRDLLSLTWQLRILAWLGVRLVWTVHNLKGHESGHDDDRDEVVRARERSAHLAVMERAEAILLHCEAARRGLIERYQPDEAARAKMHIVPHGSYVAMYAVDADARAARAALGLEGADTVFAFVGSIRGYKGVGELLEAFSSAADLGPGVRLLICGKPLPKSLGVDLERRAAADPRIILRLERIPEEELSGVLRAADAVVLPFRDILTSGSAILALSHGRPVIAPALGCLPETLPADATFLYDADAPGALGVALGEAPRPHLATMGERARRPTPTRLTGRRSRHERPVCTGQAEFPRRHRLRLGLEDLIDRRRLGGHGRSAAPAVRG